MYNLNQLIQFVTIVEEGNMTKAADKLYISQPALSRSMSKFEEELEVNLFDHSKNKIVLNQNGELAYKLSKDILSKVYKMKDTLISNDKDRFVSHIGSCAPAPIWGIEKIFNKVCPTHQSDHKIISSSHDLITGLLDDTYTLIVLNHQINNEELIGFSFFKESLYLYVPNDSKWASKKSLTFNEINGSSIILSSKIGFWSDLCKLNLPDSHLLYQDDDKTIDEIVKSSTLPTFRTNVSMSSSSKEDLNRIAIPITDKEATMEFYIYFKKQNKNKYIFIKDKIKEMNWN
ncbi:MAG: LysR family transcriptional regulator [Thomasclavelia sp.]|jgi:DNA-binding transcriptional LysR family regulator|nr:LysR family transcriptional regulator [Thomasclavelia sp.]